MQYPKANMQSVSSLINLSLSETIGGNVETFSLIWLDASVNDPENDEIQQKLRLNINCVKIFDKLDECQKYIEKMSPNDRTILIVSGSLGQIIIPHVHHYQQISSIYVFCVEKKRNEIWARDFKKIKQVITDDDDLITEVQKDYKEQTKIRQPITFTVLKKEDLINSTSILNSEFADSYLLVDFLLRLESDGTDKSELFSFCRHEYCHNTNELQFLNRFQNDYLPEKALWWYTLEAFPYRMLNKALRTQGIHLLYLYRFFMNDIYQQLLEHQYQTSIRVYRGQYMTNDELQSFVNSIGEIISTNSFLSTSSDRNIALEFIDNNQPINSDLHKVLFKIDASPSVGTTKPFANISQFSEYVDEAEILFSMATVFRINSVQHGRDNVRVIRMTLCDDNELGLKPIVDYINNRYKNKKVNLLLFSDILCEMNKFKEAEIYNLRFLQIPSKTVSETALCWNNLGRLAYIKSDYDASFNWHKQSLEIKQKSRRLNDINLAQDYFFMGDLYEKKDDYKQALQFYIKTLQIWKLIKSENHSDIIKCYQKLGKMKEKMAQYTEALRYYKIVLKLSEKNLPTNDIQFGTFFSDVGNAYQCLNQYDEALDNYNLALKTYQNHIPVNDMHVASVFEKIAFVYRAKKLLIQSLVYYEKTEDIYRMFLPHKHPLLNQVEIHIRNIQSKLKEDGTADQDQ